MSSGPLTRSAWTATGLALVACGSVPNAAPDLRALVDGQGPVQPVHLSAFAPAGNSIPADAPFEGRLTSVDTGEADYRVEVDEFGIFGSAAISPALPGFDFALVTDGGRLLPGTRGPVDDGHALWEYMVGPGSIWKEPGDGRWNRAAVPFTLRERNADCMHYGVLGFLYDEAGNTSEAVYQVSSQTCAYLEFSMWGRRPIDYVPGELDRAQDLRSAWGKEVASRLETRPIDALSADYPGADPAAFASPDDVPPRNLTTYGFVIDGVHYVGACPTRNGDYPYCDVMPLPSYSLAKSLFAGLAAARAEKLYPGITSARIAELVPACRETGTWDDVTIAHAMDMATGNFDSTGVEADEDAMIASAFFLAEDAAAKTAYACNAFPRRAAPGETWVYHTSDMYLAGVALAEALRRQAGPDADIYRDLVVEPLWKRLGLSPVTWSTRRTYDDARQPFFAWGLAFYRDDLARIARFLGEQEGRIDGELVFDEALIDATLQRTPDDRGLAADLPGMRYRNGFRGMNVAPFVGCDEPAWVNVLSGFGGIVLILMPNDTAYYYVSDGNTFRWLEAARASHRIRPLCGASTRGE